MDLHDSSSDAPDVVEYFVSALRPYERFCAYQCADDEQQGEITDVLLSDPRAGVDSALVSPVSVGLRTQILVNELTPGVVAKHRR